MGQGLQGRRVLLGVSGGIAAYKIPDLVRHLQKAGAEVRCLLTRNAARLVSPAALSALTRVPVEMDLFGSDGSVYTRHIEWAQWADAYVVAPATANTLARFSAGMADDPVAMAWLVVQAPKLLCPSMNTRMLDAPATRRNLSVLEGDGATVLMPDSGELACGETGPGRLPDADVIATALEALLSSGAPGSSPAASERSPAVPARSILLTMGRTEEPVDDVRILTNRSSGRTGADIASAALRAGHRVTVVCGPCDVAPPAGATVVRVTTALQMHEAATSLWPSHDWAICAAAVADFRPAHPTSGKIPASRGLASIELTPNPDILAELCASRKSGQLVVGFALETGELGRGSRKLAAKGVDLAVCNDPLHDAGHGGFGTDHVWGWVGQAGIEPSADWIAKADLASRILAALETSSS
jgi:phosphopantothenoylcysteine decarboxylase/phosphopantothenate--cysteine ligase